MAHKTHTLRHEFAFYAPFTTERLEQYSHKESFIIKDPSLYHRITNVVRLSPGEPFILFDQSNHAQCVLHSTDKKNILNLMVRHFRQNKILKPHITFLLPLLKRDAFQEAIYSLTELGANHIQLIITTTTQRKWGKNHEYERLLHILYAAAEQSKNFAFPSITPPLLLEQLTPKIEKETCCIYFDPEGQHLLQVVQKVLQQVPQKLIIMVGPEAGLTHDEKRLLNKHNFIACSLTPTILRAQQAAALSLGALRSLLKNH